MQTMRQEESIASWLEESQKHKQALQECKTKLARMTDDNTELTKELNYNLGKFSEQEKQLKLMKVMETKLAETKDQFDKLGKLYTQQSEKLAAMQDQIEQCKQEYDVKLSLQ